MANRKQTEPTETKTRPVLTDADIDVAINRFAKRTYTQAPVAVDPGVPCSHCGHRYGHRVTNTYPNGNRRRTCGKCGKPFVAMRVRE